MIASHHWLLSSSGKANRTFVLRISGGSTTFKLEMAPGIMSLGSAFSLLQPWAKQTTLLSSSIVIPALPEVRCSETEDLIMHWTLSLSPKGEPCCCG